MLLAFETKTGTAISLLPSSYLLSYDHPNWKLLAPLHYFKIWHWDLPYNIIREKPAQYSCTTCLLLPSTWIHPRSPTSPVSEEDLLLPVCMLIEKYHPGPDNNLMAKVETFCTCKPSPGEIIWKIMELQVVASGLLIHIIVNSRIMWNFADLAWVLPQWSCVSTDSGQRLLPGASLQATLCSHYQLSLRPLASHGWIPIYYYWATHWPNSPHPSLYPWVLSLAQIQDKK